MSQSEIFDHAVRAWAAQIPASLPTGDCIRVFENAIRSLREKVLVTISDVTLAAILDRVFLSSIEDYPSLSGIEVGSKDIDFERLQVNSKRYTRSEIEESLIYLTKSFIVVIDKLTAGVLTPILLNELSAARIEPSKKKSRIKGRKK